MILLMLGFSTVMGWVMAIEQVPQALAGAVLTTIDSVWLFLLVYIVFFLVIGCVFDTLAAMIILMPILLPLIDQFGIDRIHFGIVTVFALMIGILTPPLGIALYIMMDVSHLSFERLSRAAIPFLIPLMVVLIILAYFPAISLWLPNLIMGAE
jgi:TRAP-type C4-dicarboxylate transport system permease large subunit